MDQTIIGRQTLDDGRILEYGARDSNTGQRFERVINAPTQAASTVQQSASQSSNLTAEQQARYNELTKAGASASAALSAVNLIPTEMSKTPDVPTQVSSPELPTPTATSVVDQYSQTLLQREQQLRTELEKRYQSELDRINKEREESQKQRDILTAKTEGVIKEEVKPLTEPFRADLETSERERLDVEKNYFENQALVDELDTLLTQIQADVQATKDITGLASIREPRISKAVEDATARVGVIEAVMAARNNQISQAYTLIDRTIGVMEADRQDQLSYYNTLLTFYDKQRDEEGDKILTLDKEEKEIINAQISLLEGDLAQAQTNANYIKNLMIDPDTAQFIAKAGITLNDTPEEVNRKMAEQSNRDQITEYKNSLASQGYEYVPYPAGRTDLVSFGVGGQTLYFKAPTAQETDYNELLSGRQFIMDNPNATYNDLFVGLKENTNLSNEDIEKLLKDREKIVGESKVLTMKQIENSVYSLSQEEVENYFMARYEEDELKQKARNYGFEGGGFLGIGVGEKGINDFLASPAERKEIAQDYKSQYEASGYTIIE